MTRAASDNLFASGARMAAAALLGALCAGSAAARAPDATPLPALAPYSLERLQALQESQAAAHQTGAALDAPGGREAERPAQELSLSERLTMGRFSITPPADRGDGEVAAAIRRAFKGRRLSDRRKSDSPLPLKPRSGEVGFVLADPRRGAILERRNADARMIPASVAKAPTALYALDALGADHRFTTRVLIDGPIEGGVLKGDLYLVGGGDPVLDTGDLMDLAAAMKAAGLDRVDGQFFYDESAIPPVRAIMPSQPPQAGYNPALSGLMVNFNRVRLEWRKDKAGRYSFKTSTASRRGRRSTDLVVGRDAANAAEGANFEWRLTPRLVGPGVIEGAVEEWRIARKLLRSRGGRWLPVRRPGFFAAHLFQEVAHEAGVGLPVPSPRPAPTGLAELASHESAALSAIVKGMLRHSTNLTAEAVGLAASRARGLERLELERSGALMSSWADTRFGILGSTAGVDAAPTALKNHSGLSVESRLTPRAMTAILIEAAREPASFQTFYELLPRYRMKGLAKGAKVFAKTGTVYYGRGLSGYLECGSGAKLAFAYLHSDIEGRAAFDARYDPASGYRPGGASGWLGRARAIEKKLLADWSKRYC